MTLASNPIARNELILDKLIIPGLEMHGGDGKGTFAADTHMHDYTRAFGDPERREGIWLLDSDVAASFNLTRDYSRHACQLKFHAMMEQWRNKFVDIAILLNGHLLRRGPMLFQNVVLGWPEHFLALPGEHLHPGKNTLTFQNCSPLGRREAIFISQAEILIRPNDAAFQLELAPSLVRMNEPVQIRLRNVTGKPARVQIAGQYKLISQDRDGLEDAFVFVTPSAGSNQSITFSAGGHSLTYAPDRIVHADRPYDMLVGSDISDDRHDETTLDLLDFFHKTEMGNLIGFRPMLGRSCIDVPSRELFAKWFEFLHSRRLCCWLENGMQRIPWMTRAIARKFPSFIAAKFHEICHRIAPVAPSLRDAKQASAAFDKIIKDCRDSVAIPGRPFWLCSCTHKVLLLAASKHVDVPIVEPTTHDHIFHYSATRRVSAIHNKPWGTHVPPNWFLGSSHSEDKLRRFRLSLQAAHIMGAKIIYSESALFGFQPFTRYDAEHPLSQQMRIIMRNFYRYTRTQSVPPTPQAISSANILYGNCDSFFFFHDHTPLDTGRSNDRYLWYKWPFTDLDHGWMAARNLFKPLNSNEYKGYPGDIGETRFSYNPFGSVDIIPIADLAMNPLPLTLLLGRNLMTPAIYRSLISYVKKGGTLFLSLHHFNTHPDPLAAPTWLNNGDLAGLLGRKLKFSSRPAFATHPLGDGAVVCYTGETPMGNPKARPVVDEMIQSLAARFRPAIHITNDAPVYLQQYKLGQDLTQLFLLNVNWKFPGDVAQARISLAGKEFPVDVPFGPPVILHHSPAVTVFAASPLTQVYNLRSSPSQVSFTACGKDLEVFTVFAHRPSRRLRGVLVNNQPALLHPHPTRPDILQFSAPLHGEVEIVLRH